VGGPPESPRGGAGGRAPQRGPHPRLLQESRRAGDQERGHAGGGSRGGGSGTARPQQVAAGASAAGGQRRASMGKGVAARRGQASAWTPRGRLSRRQQQGARLVRCWRLCLLPKDSAGRRRGPTGWHSHGSWDASGRGLDRGANCKSSFLWVGSRLEASNRHWSAVQQRQTKQPTGQGVTTETGRAVSAPLAHCAGRAARLFGAGAVRAITAVPRRPRGAPGRARPRRRRRRPARRGARRRRRKGG
jgi:hypothetical protein